MKMSFLADRSSLSCQTDYYKDISEMVQYKNLIYNPLQVNTWIVYDDRGSCIIIDPANAEELEHESFANFVSENSLKPERILATHGHFDHLPGVRFVKEKYSIPFGGHKEDLSLLQFAGHQANLYGLDFEVNPPEFDDFIEDGDLIDWGGGTIKALHVPGHSRGSLAFHFIEQGFVFTGDALFKEGIGRTDLPGGDYETLMRSIRNKLFSLPDETRVFPGHGPETDVGHEKRHNPFFQ